MRKSNTQEQVSSSVSSIYSRLLEKRQQERETREEERRLRKEEEKAAKEASMTKEDGTKKTKKERREEEIDAWRSIIVGLTGEDLDYTADKKKKKKKYHKWIDDDIRTISSMTQKPKKHKKKNYRKEFDSELSMLKKLVASQNQFTVDLEKRFINAAGPATKDGSKIDKNIVELASVINSARGNSLGYLNAITNVKKTIADLYMKQMKLEGGDGSSASATDIALMGSSIANSLFGDTTTAVSVPSQSTMVEPSSSSTTPLSNIDTYDTGSSITNNNSSPVVTEFDPSSWEGPSLDSNATQFENVPHDIVVEWDKANGTKRFKAVHSETGEELIGCPVPTSDLNRLTWNENDAVVKGVFDEIYRLEIK